jgi:Fur family ferric uptake transcriptional regulator
MGDISSSTRLSLGNKPIKAPKEVLLAREKQDQDSLKRIIRDLGLKVTHQRMAILNALTKGRAHRTAQEIYEAVHEKHPEIGFATVYRLLRTLSEKAYVTEVRMGGLPARYELTPNHNHDHLTCTSCGKIVELSTRRLRLFRSRWPEKMDFNSRGMC